jgi:hypothetical protein
VNAKPTIEDVVAVVGSLMGRQIGVMPKIEKFEAGPNQALEQTLSSIVGAMGGCSALR